MKISYKDIELFDLISEQSDNNIDKYNLFAGDKELYRGDFEKSFIKLSALKLITIKNDGREIIIKLSNFHDAVFHGGIVKYFEYQEKREKLENDIIESNLKTNKYSRNTMIFTIIIGSLTLIALVVQIVLNYIQ